MLQTILLDILGPILLIVATGAVMRRRFGLDLTTLSKLNIYVFTPAFIFERVAHSEVTWGQIAGVAGVTTLNVLLLGALVGVGGRLLGAGRAATASLAMAVMFYNSANYGLPLTELAFAGPRGRDAAATQAFVVLTMNLLTWTLGVGIAAAFGGQRGGLREAAGAILRLPVLYTLAGALGARFWLDGDDARQLPIILDKTMHYLGQGLVPAALLTLGVQLAANPRRPRWRAVGAAMGLRLIAAPLLMAGTLLLLQRTGPSWLRLWPWPGELLILTAAVPTAVNTLLLTLEMGGDAELAADCVFWTTLASAATVAGWLVATRWAFAA